MQHVLSSIIITITIIVEYMVTKPVNVMCASAAARVSPSVGASDTASRNADACASAPCIIVPHHYRVTVPVPVPKHHASSSIIMVNIKIIIQYLRVATISAIEAF